MLADLGESPKVSKEGMNQKAFVSTLEDAPWVRSEQNPGLQYKLLVDASHADTDGFSFGILKLEPGAELAPHHSLFLRGSRILHAHSTLQRFSGMGYLSEWANEQFSDIGAKNSFYDEFGELFSPRADGPLCDELYPEMGASEVLSLARESMAKV